MAEIDKGPGAEKAIKEKDSERVLYGALEYTTLNVGDEIQSVAADQFLPRIDARFDRDKLATVQNQDRYRIILNGWYSGNPEACFPPADCFEPLIVGFHITDAAKAHFISSECIAYFKKHEPIGCRDVRTTQWLSEAGVNAYFSKCLTLTLPTRKQQPVDGKVMIVDVPKRALLLIPKTLLRDAVFRTHQTKHFGPDKMKLAHELLDEYRDHASLIITGRLHCALPCLAMGIPVVFFGDASDERLALVQDCGLKMHKPCLFFSALKPQGGPVSRRIKRVLFYLDAGILSIWNKLVYPELWSPKVLDVAEDKARLTEILQRELPFKQG